MNSITIMGILVDEKQHNAQSLQKIFTKYGCSIKTRLGLNELESNCKENAGLILLELTGNPDEYDRLQNELLQMDGIEVQRMNFKCR